MKKKHSLKWIVLLIAGELFDTAELYSVPPRKETWGSARENYRRLAKGS